MARSFSRSTRYRAATVSRLLVNLVFGFIRGAVLVEVIASSGGDRIGGMGSQELLTFSFVTQALIGVSGLFSSSELGDRIRSGEIAVDLYRPVDLQFWWSAIWTGDAALALVARGLPLMVLASLAYPLRWPEPGRIPAALVAIALGSATGFAMRYLLSLSGFWVLHIAGPSQLLTTVILFCSGMLVPLNLFPTWLEPAMRWLPFASMVQLPAEVFMGLHSGAGLVVEFLRAAAWVAVLLAAGRLVQRRAVHKVVVQGG